MLSYKQFISKLTKNKQYSLEEFKQYLKIEDVFLKDTPSSIGKRLKINRIKIVGRKDSGENIDYDETFKDGVTVIYADNNAGKSSLFKIVKLSLTGSNSLKDNIVPWLKESYVEFSIGDKIYTTEIKYKYEKNLRIEARLINRSISKIFAYEDMDNIYVKFFVKSMSSLKSNLELFFFNELSYYNLEWKSSNKKDLKLTTNKASWATYYKAIYLESKDYDSLFISKNYGQQDKKILEMLLGLEYTLSINKINNRIDDLERQEQIDNVDNENKDTNEPKINIDKLEKEVLTLSCKIKEKEKEYSDYNNVKVVSSLYKEQILVEKTLLNLKNATYILKDDLRKQKKYLLSFKETVEIKGMFDTISISNCPICDKCIPENRYDIEIEDEKCVLCNQEISSELMEIREQENESKEKKILEKIEEFKNIIKDEKEFIKKEEEKLLLIKSKVKEQESNRIENNDELYIELRELEMQKLRYESQILNFNERESKPELENDSYKELEILRYSMLMLEEDRFENSKMILDRFSQLIKDNTTKYGVKGLNDVYFNEKINLYFKQDNHNLTFENFTEGEQLRIKLAFYISLISLDTEYGFGRHPRLLFIDSPGKEEVIKEDLIELADLINNINNDGEKLQIIIGTSLEELTGATDKSKLFYYKKGENIF